MSGKKLRIIGTGVVLTLFAAVAVTEGKNERTYDRDIKKIISERCLACHGSDAPTLEAFKKDEKGFKSRQKGPRMDTYANLMVFVNGEDTGALMRRLDDGKNTKDGKPGNMHEWLGTTEQEKAANLKAIKDWIGGWTLKRKREITAEELKAIRALEK